MENRRNSIGSWLLLEDATSYEVEKIIWKKKFEERIVVVAFADIT